MTTAKPSASEILNSLHTNGYVIIPSLLSPSSPLFSSVLNATKTLTQRARAGNWPYVRTLPKQFPPWNVSDARSHGIWGVQHLLHPALPAEERESFAAVYFAEELLHIAEIILGISSSDSANDSGRESPNGHLITSSETQDELVMELFNLLVTPGTAEQGVDFSLSWHRDDISPDVTGEAEQAALGLSSDTHKTYSHTQFNLCLTDEDSSLIVVPGSHLRARTPEEISLMAGDTYPFCAGLPGQVTTRLRAGDVVFYDNNIVHRGVYAGAKERYTLHGSYSRKGAAAARARNVLQHGVGNWIQECGFEELGGRQRSRPEAMKAGLVQMGREGGWTGEYSLRG